MNHHSDPLRDFLTTAMLTMVLIAGKAAGAGLVDRTFDASTRYNTQIGADVLAVQADGKVLVGHRTFTGNWPMASGLSRVTSKGKPDTGFKPKIGNSGGIASIAPLPDGKILVGGNFADHFVMLNTDGSRNAGYLLGRDNGKGTVNGTVNSILPLPEGKVIIAGDFRAVGYKNELDPGMSRSGIARLNADGSVDTGFDPGEGLVTDAWTSSSIKVVVADTVSDKIYIAGSFSRYDGKRANRVARLNANGSLDESFYCYLEANGGPLEPAVNSLVVQPDGKIVIAGTIPAVNATPTMGVVRLKRDGMADTGFLSKLKKIKDVDLEPGPLLALKDGKLLVPGTATYKDKRSAGGLVRLNPDGSLDQAFPSAAMTGNIAGMIPDKAGKALLAGTFTRMDEQVRVGVARVSPGATVLYKIRVIAAEPSQGIVSKSTSAVQGSTVTVSAKPKPGFKFIYWKDGGKKVTTKATYRFKAVVDRNLAAFFGPVGK